MHFAFLNIIKNWLFRCVPFYLQVFNISYSQLITISNEINKQTNIICYILIYWHNAFQTDFFLLPEMEIFHLLSSVDSTCQHCIYWIQLSLLLQSLSSQTQMLLNNMCAPNNLLSLVQSIQGIRKRPTYRFEDTVI